MPKLVHLEKWQKQSYEKYLDTLKNDLFRKFPPYYIVSDYSNEKTFSDLLERIYGESKIEKIGFTTTTKQMLKDDGSAILKQGYVFPNPDKVINQVQKELLIELIQQLKSEQMLITKAGKITYDHPYGRHNDLAIAWELSIHGCQRKLLKSPPTMITSISMGELRNEFEDKLEFPKISMKKDIYYPNNSHNNF